MAIVAKRRNGDPDRLAEIRTDAAMAPAPQNAQLPDDGIHRGRSTVTFIPDLEPCDYFENELATNLIAVGWLEGSYPYPQRRIGDELFERLVEVMALSFWIAPVAWMGGHGCSLCPGGEREHETFLFRGRRFGMGAANLFLPGEGALFVAPSLIIHYVRDHFYLPPKTFCEALRTCPTVGSEEYKLRWDAACPPQWRGHIYHAVERSREMWKQLL